MFWHWLLPLDKQPTKGGGGGGGLNAKDPFPKSSVNLIDVFADIMLKVYYLFGGVAGVCGRPKCLVMRQQSCHP